MTKQDAETAMKDGKKVSHSYFKDSEFLYMINGIIYDENGYMWGNLQCDAWLSRNWDECWYIKD